MLGKLCSRLTYTNVAVTIAVLFAMSGGALAASKVLITSVKQISPKVVTALKGKAGPTGAAGSQGPAGVAGKDGSNGKDGAKGADGQSVTSAEVPTSSATCGKQGGAEFTAASGKTTACNGSPWTVGGLPKGATETGVWAVSQFAHKFEAIAVPVSFTVPLTKAIPGTSAHFINAEEGEGEAKENLPAGCKGSYTKPAAENGQLCVFISGAPVNIVEAAMAGFELVETEPSGADKVGTRILFLDTGSEGEAVASGTWAVTG
jgi:hypothetical protein